MSSAENESKLNTALKYHKNGQLPEAEIIYRHVIEEDPEDYNALNLFGVLLYQHGRLDEAVEYVKRAIELHPIAYFYINLGNIYTAQNEPDKAIDQYQNAVNFDAADADPWFGMGACYKSKNQLEKAIECYEKAITLNPSYCSAHINLGNIYNEKKDYNKAIEYYKKAILFNQNDADVYNSLGKVYFTRYEFDEAKYCYEKAIKIKPNFENAYLNLSELYKIKGEINQAVQNIHMALEINPENYEAYIGLGNLMIYINRTEEALDCFNAAMQINPDKSGTLLNIGNAYRDSGNQEKALEYYLKAQELLPDSPEVLVNLGNAYSDLNEFDKAVDFFKKAIDIKPDMIIAYLNLGHLYIERNNPDEALIYFKKALEKDPNYAETHFNLGTTYLLTKDLKNGFKHYEWRDRVINIKHPKYIEINKPKWDGSSLKDKTILLCHEQGLGDTLQFARYLPELASVAKKVLFKPPVEMIDLFKRTDLNVEIIDNSIPVDQIECDCFTYLLSLPYYLKSTYDSIPLSEGYLKADPAKIKLYKEKYFNNDRFKIGIKWQGNPYGNKNRSIPFNLFLKLANITGVKLYSFQKGNGIEELDNIPKTKKSKLIDLGSTFNDFSDTAAALTNIDLLICNDTSLVHLAGAMNIKTWVLLPFIPEWRWFMDQTDSPWYKSVRLFRQKDGGNWEKVMKNVIQALKEQIHSD